MWLARFAPLAILAILYGGAVLTRNREHRTDQLEWKESWILFGLFVFGVVVPPAAFIYSGRSHSYYWLAILAYALNFGVLFATLNALGSLFSPSLQIAKEHKLVTSGIYAWARHPMYVAGALFLCGQVLMFPTRIGAVSAVLAYSLILFFRIPAEEALMMREFGDEYAAYKKRVPGLFIV